MAPPGPDADDWRRDMAGLIAEGRATYEYSHGWVRDTRDDTWVRIPERPSSAYDESLASVGNALVVFGGQDWGTDDRGADGSATKGRLVSEAWVWTPPSE